MQPNLILKSYKNPFTINGKMLIDPLEAAFEKLASSWDDEKGFADQEDDFNIFLDKVSRWQYAYVDENVTFHDDVKEPIHLFIINQGGTYAVLTEQIQKFEKFLWQIDKLYFWSFFYPHSDLAEAISMLIESGFVPAYDGINFYLLFGTDAILACTLPAKKEENND